MKHVSHVAIIKRLKRAQGHLASTIAMFEEGRPCRDLAQQLHAVESAVASAKREMIHDHIEHCLQDGSLDAREAIAELKVLTKYLER
jgi:DNA-binding FrmR family transcriptional regulator